MRFLTFIAVFCLLLAPPAAASGFDADTFRLDNGLQVIVIPNHRAPVVTHMVWYKYGGAEFAPGKSGIAHFFEHLMFKGTKKVPDGQFSAIVRKLGGNDNAFTTHDYTAYYQNIPRRHLARVMEMEADRMKNLTLTESQVDSERQVIIEERRQRIDNTPQAKFREQMMSVLFVNHPYGTPVIGWLNEILGLTREDVLAEYRRWYAPNNAIVIVSGDVTAREMRPLAEKYYGGLESSELPPRVRPQPAPIVAQQRLFMDDPRIGLASLTKTYRAQRGNDALDMLSEIVGGGATSRLYRSLVVEKRLAVSAGTDYEPISLDDTTFTIYAAPAPGTTVAQLEAAMDAEVRRLLEKGVTAEELKAAKSKKKAELIYYLDSLQGPAILFGRAIASGFDIGYVENRNARLDKLTAGDVNRATQMLFAANNLPVTGILLPRPENKKRGTK